MYDKTIIKNSAYLKNAFFGWIWDCLWWKLKILQKHRNGNTDVSKYHRYSLYALSSEIYSNLDSYSRLLKKHNLQQNGE